MNLKSLPASIRDRNPHLFEVKGKVPGKEHIPKPMPEGLLFIVNHLLYQKPKIHFVRELQFAKDLGKKYRFDIAIYEKMVAIEYEGLVATGKKGAHQTKKGYTNNTGKYNLAQSLGWKVYRYTYLNYRNFTEDLKKIIRPE